MGTGRRNGYGEVNWWVGQTRATKTEARPLHHPVIESGAICLVASGVCL